MALLKRGAEAVLSTGQYDGRPAVVKERIPKPYRIPALDRRIRARRTAGEQRLLNQAARHGIPVPRVLGRDRFTLFLERLAGLPVNELLQTVPKTERLRLYTRMGDTIARLHAAGIIHGDLTTSNMILVQDRLCLIDFGLGSLSAAIEDQAVDLSVLYETLLSTRPAERDEAWTNILNAYRQQYSQSPAVLKRLDAIKKRRRYR